MMRSPALHVRLAIIAAAVLAAAGAVSAEPAKVPARQTETQQKRPATVVLASADEVRDSAPSARPAAQHKRARVARVTTCRCGDIVPEEDPQR